MRVVLLALLSTLWAATLCLAQTEEGAVQFEKDASGLMVIWKRVLAPDVFNGPIAGRPFVERVYRVLDGKMVDATPEFCEGIFGDKSPYERIGNAELSPQNIAKFRNCSIIYQLRSRPSPVNIQFQFVDLPW